MPNTNVLSTATAFECESTERASAVVGTSPAEYWVPEPIPVGGADDAADFDTDNASEWGNGRAYDADRNTFSSRG